MQKGLILGSVESVRYSAPKGNFGESCFISLDGGIQLIATGVAPDKLPKPGTWAIFEIAPSRRGALMLQAWGWPVFAGKSLNKDASILQFKAVLDLRGESVSPAVGMVEV